MKFKLSTAAFIFLSLIALAPLARANVTPTASLSPFGANAQLLVHGDPNSAVILYYGEAGTASANLGTTNQAGDFSVVLAPDSYGFGCGKTAHVLVNWAESAPIPWLLGSGSGACQTLALSQTSLGLAVGQSAVVTVGAGGSFSITSVSNPEAVNTVMSGNQLTVTAVNNGRTTLTICGAGNDCAQLAVVVSDNAALTFGETNPRLTVGQSRTINIFGTGGYGVVNNSNAAAVAASLSGSSLTLTGQAAGSANLIICQTGGQCGTLFVTVAGPLATPLIPPPPPASALSYLTIAAHGQFMAAGSSLIFTIVTTGPAANPVLMIGAARPDLSGSGSGPYSASYPITGREVWPLPVVFTFTDPAGKPGRVALTLGDASGAAGAADVGCAGGAAYSAATGQACPLPTPAGPSSNNSSADSYHFTAFLQVNSTGAEVTQLQKRLTALGVYSGPITGRFGPLTEAAVKKLQRLHGITQAGYVGPATRQILNN